MPVVPKRSKRCCYLYELTEGVFTLLISSHINPSHLNPTELNSTADPGLSIRCDTRD